MASNFFDKDMGWDKLYTSFEAAPGESTVFIGFLRSSGVYKKGEQITVAQVAAINEFGSKDGRIPERSFMRSAVSNNASAIKKLLDKASLQVVDGKITTERALGILGEFVKGKMVARINEGVPPKNAPSTIARKGSSKPLIDTGQLKNSIDWEVKRGKK